MNVEDKLDYWLDEELTPRQIYILNNLDYLTKESQEEVREEVRMLSVLNGNSIFRGIIEDVYGKGFIDEVEKSHNYFYRWDAKYKFGYKEDVYVGFDDKDRYEDGELRWMTTEEHLEKQIKEYFPNGYTIEYIKMGDRCYPRYIGVSK